MHLIYACALATHSWTLRECYSPLCYPLYLTKRYANPTRMHVHSMLMPLVSPVCTKNNHIYSQYPAVSGVVGRAGLDVFALHSSFQFLGVNLSTMDLNAACDTVSISNRTR